MLDIANYLTNADLNQNDENCIGVTEIFFDGEEAFIDFNSSDGLYGSKHLAQKWTNQSAQDFGYESEIERIRLFILLDLIGAPSPNFKSYAVSLR